MGFFDDIGDAFKTAGEAVGDAAKTGADKVADVGKMVGEPIARGAVTFNSGLTDLMHGNPGDAAREMAFGLAEASGIPVPGGNAGQPPTNFEQIVADSMNWSYTAFTQRNVAMCFSEYRDHVRGKYQESGLEFSSASEASLRTGASQMSWINLGC